MAVYSLSASIRVRPRVPQELAFYENCRLSFVSLFLFADLYAALFFSCQILSVLCCHTLSLSLSFFSPIRLLDCRKNMLEILLTHHMRPNPHTYHSGKHTPYTMNNDIGNAHLLSHSVSLIFCNTVDCVGILSESVRV